MRIVSVANQKGGVAKTTTVLNLGAALGIRGKRVLVIDLDPQGNLTKALGMDGKFKVSIYDCLSHGININEAVQTTEFTNLSIVCANIKLANAELELATELGRETILADLLKELDKDKYDYVLIDCNPSLGLLPINALVASDGIIIPMEASIFALEGIEQFLNIYKLIRKKFNDELTIDGVLLTRVDSRTKDSKDFYDEVVELFGDKVFKTIIHQNIRVSQAHNERVPVVHLDAGSRGAQDYIALAEEYESHGEI